MRVLVTGSAGFIGQHIVEAVSRRPGVTVLGYDLPNGPADLEQALAVADAVLHLAGVNRPERVEEFEKGNAGLTGEICGALERMGRKPLLVLSSSVQALLDNPYGRSKRQAEQFVQAWAEHAKAPAIIFRLKNVFGKWCRPNYNSVTATFCHNIAHDLPVTISDPKRELELVYVDHVVVACLDAVDHPPAPGVCEFREVSKSFRVTLGDLADRIRLFRQSRKSLTLPSLADEFTRCLYACYLSYLDGPEFAYDLEQRIDPRGTLAEFMKSEQFGQIFVSRTKPGITRGNHYHHTKVEKFLVVEGQAVVRFRDIRGGGVIEHKVDGRDFRVVDIPPGYTHSIENVGTGELVVLFWASEIFNPGEPDVVLRQVLEERGG